MKVVSTVIFAIGFCVWGGVSAGNGHALFTFAIQPRPKQSVPRFSNGRHRERECPLGPGHMA
jgi:hypothetical protein